MKYYFCGEKPQWPHPLELYIRDVNFFRYNWHPECEFLLLLRGKISLCTSGVIFHLREGDMFLVAPNRGHAMLSEERESFALVLRFSPEFFSEMVPALQTGAIHCASSEGSCEEPRFKRMRRYAAQMMLAAVSQKRGAPFWAHGAFSMLLGTLLSDFSAEDAAGSESPSERKNMKTIKTVTDWLEKNFDRRVTLDDAAEIARYNRTYFSSFFKRNVGISFYDYLTRIRFRHALYQLNNTGKSLTQVAVDCGFPDLKTFSTYYKKIFHEPPSERLRSRQDNTFTPAGEDERIFLDTGNASLAATLKNYAGMDETTPSKTPALPYPEAAKLAQLADLGAQIAALADRMRKISCSTSPLNYK